MTLADLHQIPNFPELFNDARFRGLIQYLQSNPSPRRNKEGGYDATFIIRSEGAWQGWYECIETALSAGKPIIQQQIPKKVHAYPNPHPEKTESK